MEKSMISLGHVKSSSQLIELRNNDLLRNIKIELIVLYWKIGKILIKQIETDNGGLKDKQLIENLSEKLTTNYGKLLSKRNLKRMMLFTKHFSDISLAQQASTFLSWRHILKLLKIESLELKWDYIEFAIREGLSPKELGEAIRNKIIEKKSLLNNSLTSKHHLNSQNDEWYTEMMMICINQPALINEMAMDFTTYYTSADFRKLLSPSISTKASIEKRDERISNLLLTLIEEIEVFRKTHNYWLNATLNRSFREIGSYINEHIYFKDEKNHKNSSIDVLSKTLTAKYGSNFTRDQLVNMANFSNNVSDRVSLRISCLVTWEHLLVISQLTDPCEQLFYARIAAKEGLNAVSLEKLINEDTYRKTPGAEEKESQTLNVLNNPTVTVKKTKVKRQIVVVTEHLIELGEDTRESKVVVDIFKSKYFPLIEKKYNIKRKQ